MMELAPLAGPLVRVSQQPNAWHMLTKKAGGAHQTADNAGLAQGCIDLSEAEPCGEHLLASLCTHAFCSKSRLPQSQILNKWSSVPDCFHGQKQGWHLWSVLQSDVCYLYIGKAGPDCPLVT